MTTLQIIGDQTQRSEVKLQNNIFCMLVLELVNSEPKSRIAVGYSDVRTIRFFCLSCFLSAAAGFQVPELFVWDWRWTHNFSGHFLRVVLVLTAFIEHCLCCVLSFTEMCWFLSIHTQLSPGHTKRGSRRGPR